MRVEFTKMHGLGNDFVILDARKAELPEISRRLAAALANRRTGIGCDQLIRLDPSACADLRMRIYNSDGGEVEACGNAARAVALLHGEPARLETRGGIIEIAPQSALDIGSPNGATSGAANVDMGVPRFDWEEIPLAFAMDTQSMPIGWEELENPIAVNVGNPHLVFFTEDCEVVDLARLGPIIELDPLFPERINVNVASIGAPGRIDLRVWERGAGLTRACGTGACATAVAAARRGLSGADSLVNLPGGTLEIHWEEGGSIRMSGPAAQSFRGSFEWDDYA